jgi:S-(hydroxymethyl)glutathione dehydrogenase/alcohol dehydrogenase
MEITAAVLSAPRTPVVLETLHLAEPGPGEVLLRYTASGVCHSDLHVVDGDWARPMPIALGHEGAAAVESVGAGVSSVGPGDHVVLTWAYPCGVCSLCLRGRTWLCESSSAGRHVLADGTSRIRRPSGEEVYQYLAIATMSTAAVVPAAACVPIPAAVPPEVAALIGCGVATGYGAVVNTAAVRPGEIVCVVGCGGVGLSAVMAARLAGASRVIAVDASPASLALAESVGATELVPADDGWPAAVRALVPDGVDSGFDCIGVPAVATGLLETLVPGGTLVLVGMTAQGVTVPLDGYRVPDRGYRVLGSSYGSCVAAVDFPAIAELYLGGRLPLDRLVTRRIGLDGIEAAFQAMRRREGGRTVVVH